MMLLKFLLGDRFAWSLLADGEAGAGDGTPPAAGVTLPPAGVVPPAAPVAFQAPAEFANEPWAAKVKTIDDLWKMNANAQSLIGRQGIKLPAPTATAEEKIAWKREVARTHFEVPAAPDAYQFDAIEGYQRSPEREKAARELFHKLDIPAPAARELVKWYESTDMAARAEAEKANAELDAQFGELSKALWGDQAPQVIERLGTLLAKEVPAPLQGVIEKLPGEALLALGTLVDNVHQKYTKQSTFVQNLGKLPFNTPAAGIGETLDELSSTQRKIMSDPGFGDPFAANHSDLQRINAQIREKMTALLKK